METVADQAGLRRSEAVGGDGGGEFQFCRSTEAIRRVGIRTGDFVDAIKVLYTAGPTYSAGGGGGALKWLDLDVQAGEYITSIEGRCGDLIDWICIRTSKGRQLSGGGGGGEEFRFQARSGEQILGFYGGCGSYVDRLGMIFAPAPVPPINGHVG